MTGETTTAFSDALLRDSLALVRGKRVGLVTNHTGVSTLHGEPGRTSSVDVLHARDDFEPGDLQVPWRADSNHDDDDADDMAAG